jgi:hypothetical protein
VESSTEQHASTGEVNQVAGWKISSESDGNWPGTSNREERCSVSELHRSVDPSRKDSKGFWGSKAESVAVIVQESVTITDDECAGERKNLISQCS